jgi:LmbE family N-acetylglucosaminyl deacetylase
VSRRRRALVISPHRKHVLAGDEVHVVFLTSGEKGGHGRSEDQTIALREQESAAAKEILGVHGIEFYREPDGAVRVRAALIGRLASKLKSWRPDVVYVPHAGEMHADHRAALRLVRAAVRAAQNGRPGPDVLMYEVWTPLARMDDIVDITPYVKDKRRAIRAYRSQCAVMSFDEAALGLNRYRGEMFCWPEGEYAEVFARLQP